MASQYNQARARQLARIAALVGEHEAYAIVNDRVSAQRNDKRLQEETAIADQLEAWFGETCNDNGFPGSCGCTRCLSPQVPDSGEPLEF